MEDRVDQFMRAFNYDHDSGQWYLEFGDFDARMPVSEEDVNEAEAGFRFRFRIATALSWLLTLGAFGWCYYRFLVEDSFGVFLWVIPVWYLTFVIYLWATFASNRKLRIRLWEYDAEQREKADLSPVKQGSKLPPRRVVKMQLGVLSAIWLAFSGYVLWQYRVNSWLLSEGTTVSATVTRSDDNGPKHTCVVDYSYQWEGRNYTGGVAKCAIMEAHPVGSALPVRIDPDKPDRSIEPSQSPWPPAIVAPIVLTPLLLIALVTI
jgi:hypothetical protein